jgi:hypothetical protein
VVCYQNNISPYSSAVKVGTVSGTSISFGSEQTIKGTGNSIPSIAFDKGNTNTFVAIFSEVSTYHGKAVVGTISGTSVSFGGDATYASTPIYQNTVAADPNNTGKFIIAYQDGSNSNYGTCVVGTISGGSISYGTATVFNAANNDYFSSAFDPNNSGKFAVTYRDVGNSKYGTAVIGSVSGTSVSFGSEVVFNAGETETTSVSFDENNNNVFAVGYEDISDSYYGKVVFGTISGTSVSFSNEVAFNEARTDHLAVAFDPNQASSLLTAYRDGGDSSKGKAILSTATNLTSEGFVGFANSGAPDGQGAKINIKGAVDESQSGLTAGQSYYVQTDGTLGTTPADPSVFAGTAVAATKLIVKG